MPTAFRLLTQSFRHPQWSHDRIVVGGLNWKNARRLVPSEGWLTAVKQVSAERAIGTQRLTDLEIDSALSGYPGATLPLPVAWLPCGRNRSDPSST